MAINPANLIVKSVPNGKGVLIEADVNSHAAFEAYIRAFHKEEPMSFHTMWWSGGIKTHTVSAKKIGSLPKVSNMLKNPNNHREFYLDNDKWLKMKDWLETQHANQCAKNDDLPY